jgi:hypothetical protein
MSCNQLFSYNIIRGKDNRVVQFLFIFTGHFKVIYLDLQSVALLDLLFVWMFLWVAKDKTCSVWRLWDGGNGGAKSQTCL